MMKVGKLLDLSEHQVGYLKARDIYLANAKHMIDEGELGKASELLWGACSQMILAIASLKGIPLPGHSETKEFVRELGKEIRDEEIGKLFSKIESLHANFYHNFIPKEEFPEYLEIVKKFLEKLEKIKGGIVAKY